MEQPPNLDSKILEKQKRFERALENVEKIVDGLGRPIDEKIKETIAILHAMDIPTDSSCGGHTGDEGGRFGTPYVRIYAPEPDGWRHNEKLQKEWTIENLKQRAKMQPLLDAFNSTRTSSKDAMLHFDDIGMYGGFNIESKANIKFRSESEAIEKITQYQNEMRDFTEFLKREYYES